MYLPLEERQNIQSTGASSQALCSFLSHPPFSKDCFLVLEKTESLDVFGGFSEKNSFLYLGASTPKAGISKVLPCLLFSLVARQCLKQCQDYLFPHCPTALASPPKGTEINCKLMVIRATPTPMLISTRKSILCLEEHAMESPFLLVLLSALPLSTLGCSYSTMLFFHRQKKKHGKTDKAATAACFLSLPQLITQFHSHILNQVWKPLGLWQWQDKRFKYGKGQLRLSEPGAGKASQHGQYRLVNDTSAGALFVHLAAPLCGTYSACWEPLLFLAQNN